METNQSTARCLLCGRLHFGRRFRRCPNCQGLCTQVADSELRLLERRRTKENQPIARSLKVSDRAGVKA